MRLTFSAVCALTVLLLTASGAAAQWGGYPTAPTGPVTSGIGSQGSNVDIPQTNLQPIISYPSTGQPSSSTLFDPYATNPGAGTLYNPGSASPLPAAGGGPSNYPNGSFLGRLFSMPASTPGGGLGSPITAPNYPFSAPGSFATPGYGGPMTVTPPGAEGIAPQTFGTVPGQPPPMFGGPAFGNPGFGSQSFGGTGMGGTSYPPSIYPSNTPTTMFPSGLFPQTGGSMWPGGATGPMSSFRFVHGPRLRHGYILGGSDNTDVGINTTDVSVAFAFPHFLYSTQPLYVVPSFSLHLWDGPTSSGSTSSSDLPSSVYDGFLDFGWQSDPNQILGAELGVRVGAFTDFDTFDSDSIRVRGKGLGSFRLTPASTLKAGIYYLDRDNVKLLPAGGLLWQPSPFTRFDIFFPEPKFARYWTTIGRSDVWWYASGEFGGGAWTIRRADGTTDSVDLSDLRVMLGLEWGQSEAIRAGRRTAFMEIGFVFEREVQYRRNRDDNFNADDSIMFRAGFGY